ncbi:polysaccharide biosynthesis protein [Shewanella algae]|uniref:lipopolysaccharide biosynthesis protein n=1 Tax=Shewanella algae TaxID=38313 RepID=UPI0008DD36F2|nr:oligosaccharide flippase family protein [Shewanella algae]OHY54783.1 polysaccharide biosynthesis protein [Shewanella algae]TVL10473.1 polysaccharide biosynthesis protein [Shewanella algae]
MLPQKVLHFSLGPIGSALLGFISLPIVAWVFSQEDVGKMALLNVVLSFTTLFFTLGLDQGYVREFHESKNKPLLLKTATIPGLILLLIVLAVCLAFGPMLAELVFSLESVSISWLLGLALLASFLSRFLSLVLRMNERGLAFSMSQLLPKAFVLIIILAYLVFDIAKTFEHLLLANALAIVFACLIFAWNTRNEWRLSINQRMDFQQLRQMLHFGLPLIVGGVAFWGLTSLDRILLSRWSSYSELAVYSISVSFAAAATIFQSVFSTVWAPTVYKWASKDEGHDKVIMVSRYVLLLVIILFCVAGLLSWVVPYLLPAEYVKVQWILVACLAYPLFYTLSETTVVGIGITRKTAYAMLACMFALLVNVACNYILIPRYGAAGAASSTALAFWAFLVFRTEFSIRLWKPLPRTALYSFTFLCITGAVSSALEQERLGFYVYLYWFGLLFGCFFYFRSECAQAMRKALSLLSSKAT